MLSGIVDRLRGTIKRDALLERGSRRSDSDCAAAFRLGIASENGHVELLLI
jgi:hypothetical protein